MADLGVSKAVGLTGSTMTGGGSSSGDFFGGAGSGGYKFGFFNHVFDTSEPAKAEIMNIAQYALLSLIPVVLLNKLLARLVPDADPDASSIELLAEIIMQVIVVFVGMVIIHRVVTYVPTWSRFRYEPFILTNSILAFLVIVLSLNTKLGLKCSLLYDRAMEALGVSDRGERENSGGSRGGGRAGAGHSSSQADFMNAASGSFPPLPQSTNQAKPQGMEGLLNKTSSSGSSSGGGGGASFDPIGYGGGIQAANSLLGSAFK